ncbi:MULTISPECIES: sigma-70 family RNA polymerase sigma factor [unclassified Streptomyces]|uniref:RNA polymerase sigma factor n=1 Tax=unclassified Streptomyces TaxID=2593676 RepID=UPI00035D7935|nr:sigma-70 family RNA polymerase sigma factor [Streptomyces sp. HmicA12]
MNTVVTEVERAEDAVLTLAAQGGDVAALAQLLERHRPGMRAVAVSLLGPGPDADDVMQEAALVALRRIGDVRNPAAVGPWLRMVVRNAGRAVLRDARRIEPVADVPTPSLSITPEQVLDRHTMRDWIWEAVEALSPALQLPVVLRYFSLRLTSYQQIARACGIPVGTVRSRLSQARTRLARTLEATAEGAHSEARAWTGAAWAEARATLVAAERGEFATVVADRYAWDVSLHAGGELLGGTGLLLAGMDSDLSAGVRQRPVHVIAGRSLMVWEMDLISPPDAPDHCPPGVAWIMTLRQGRVDRLTLCHTPRPRSGDEGVAG